MGRRARTNCSPIDSAMEKYHNDIGSRLSGVFVPPQPCLDNGSNPTHDALNMLTLDMRTKAHINNNNVNNNNNTNATDDLASQTSDGHSHHSESRRDRDCSPSQCPVSAKKTEKSQTLPISLAKTASLAMSSTDQKTQESHSYAEDKEKRGLVDILTRALFQRKHTCSRCQRKSRSCLPNKKFNSAEKHYTCGRCRESSHNMKSLVSGQNNNNTNNNCNSDGSLRLTNGEVILNKPRIHLKDSGYETVTSCSTVASSHSHNSAASGPTKNQIPISQRGNSATPISGAPSSASNQQQLRNQGQTSHCHPAGLEQYMGVTSDNNSPVRVLKQVKTRYVENYDGYLPSAQTSQAYVVKRPALPVFAQPTSEGVDSMSYTAAIENAYTYGSNDLECTHAECQKDTTTKKGAKACYTCGTSSKPCFRLPWEGGWLCEDCLDGVY